MKIQKFEDRWFQLECEDALLKDVLSSPDCHPVAAVPTAGGKTKILANFIYKYLELRPTHKVAVVSFTEDILLQDYSAIQSFFPGINIGLYSSGLNSRTIEKITVAGIQSIYKKPELFKDVDLVLVDEVHTVPVVGNGMFRQFFGAVDCQRCGLSATIFRTGHGYIYQGKGALFNKLSYNLCTVEKFNRLVDEGYLSKLYSKPTKLQLDTSKVKKSAGDFNIKDLANTCDRESITKEAVKEVVEFGHNYKSWLIFAIDIEHANNINRLLVNSGINSKALHSDTSKDRRKIKKDFKEGKLRCVVSVGMVTTGFDVPNIDLIVLLRPTESPVLHVQMIGRGLRICLASGKTHCLVLDFSGNISRLGPINNVIVPQKGKKKKGTGAPIVKTCPNCGCLHHPLVKVCDVCNHKFVFREKIRSSHQATDVVQKAKEKWMNVTGVSYSIHKKIGSPNSLKVTYSCGISKIQEFICFDHSGYAKHIANNWVEHRWEGHGFPTDVSSLFRNAPFLKKPSKIFVSLHSKYPSIKSAEF